MRQGSAGSGALGAGSRFILFYFFVVFCSISHSLRLQFWPSSTTMWLWNIPDLRLRLHLQYFIRVSGAVEPLQIWAFWGQFGVFGDRVFSADCEGMKAAKCVAIVFTSWEANRTEVSSRSTNHVQVHINWILILLDILTWAQWMSRWATRAVASRCINAHYVLTPHACA